MPSAAKNNRKTQKNEQSASPRNRSPAACATASVLATAASNPSSMSRRFSGGRQTLRDQQFNVTSALFAIACRSTPKQAPPGTIRPSAPAPTPPTLVETTPGILPDGTSLVNFLANPAPPSPSLRWTIVQRCHFSRCSLSCPPSLRRWHSSLIKQLQLVIWDIWDHRNAILHKASSAVALQVTTIRQSIMADPARQELY